MTGYIERGNNYLLRIEIPKDITDEQLKDAEHLILGSIFKPKDIILIPGVVTTAAYRPNKEIEYVANVLKEEVFETIRKHLASITFEEITNEKV